MSSKQGETSFITRVRRGLARRLDPPPPPPPPRKPVPVKRQVVRALRLAEQRLADDVATKAEVLAFRDAKRAYDRRHHLRLQERMTPLDKDLAKWRTQSLTEIATKTGTDKWGVHFYTPHYDRHLQHLRDQSFTLLEIGIGGYARERRGGNSLRMWKHFLPHARIVGLDIEDKSFVEEERIHAVLGSQTDEATLLRAIEDHGVPLVVVDDGSHVPADIITTFNILFPLLPDGAIYAIEDTQTSYWPEWGGQEDPQAAGTSMDLVKRLLDGLNHEEFVLEDYQPSYTDLHVVAVHAYHNLVVIEKGDNTEGSNKTRVLTERYDTPAPETT